LRRSARSIVASGNLLFTGSLLDTGSLYRKRISRSSYFNLAEQMRQLGLLHIPGYKRPLALLSFLLYHNRSSQRCQVDSRHFAPIILQHRRQLPSVRLPPSSFGSDCVSNPILLQLYQQIVLSGLSSGRGRLFRVEGTQEDRPDKARPRETQVPA